MLHRCADVVKALSGTPFRDGAISNLSIQTVFVGDGLVKQIQGQRIAFFLFGALEEFFELLF